VKRRQNAGDEIVIVGGKNAEGIPDFIFEFGTAETDLDMPGFFSEPGLLSRRRERKVA
jgi:hypothetical protein